MENEYQMEGRQKIDDEARREAEVREATGI
jgi:hypothetical protein